MFQRIIFLMLFFMYGVIFPVMTHAAGVPHPDDMKKEFEDFKTKAENTAKASPSRIDNVATKCHMGTAGSDPFLDTVGFFATKEQAAGVLHHYKDAKEGVGNGGTPYPAELFYRTNKTGAGLTKEQWYDDAVNPIDPGNVSLGDAPGQVRCPGLPTGSPLCTGAISFQHMLSFDKHHVSFQDQLNVGLYGASGLDSGAGLNYKPGSTAPQPGSFSADYLRRGELLVYHPLAAPVNLMMWCVALEAQAALPFMVSHAVRLFTLLMILEFIWMTINFVLKSDTIGELLDALITKGHVWAITASMILTGYYGFREDNWGYAIFSSFNKIGVEAVQTIYLSYKDATNPDPLDPNLSSLDTSTGSGAATMSKDLMAGEALSPGSFFAMGVLMLTTIWQKVSFNIFNPINLLYIFLCLLITPILVMMFSKMVADICLVVLEGYLGTGILLILVAFGATRFGQEFLQRVIVYFTILGFKLLSCYFLFAVGIRMMSYSVISLHFSNGGLLNFIESLMAMLGIMLLMGFLFHRLPSAAANFMGGSPMLSFGLLLGDTMENLSPATKMLSAAGKGAKFAAKKSGATKAFSNAMSKVYHKHGAKKEDAKDAGNGGKSALHGMISAAAKKLGGIETNKTPVPGSDAEKKTRSLSQGGSTVLGGNSAGKQVAEKGLGGAKNSKSGTAMSDLKKGLEGVATKDVPSTGNAIMPKVVGPDDN